MHRRRFPRLIVLTLLLAAAATAAHAEYYTVTLTNGTTFETRYRPVPAEWDENVSMINTDRGNWIGIHNDEIADVTSHAESTGFGYQLDSTTLFVGWSPNDIDEYGEDGEGPNLEEMFPEAPPSAVLEQFVDSPDAGGSVGTQAIDF